MMNAVHSAVLSTLLTVAVSDSFCRRLGDEDRGTEPRQPHLSGLENCRTGQASGCWIHVQFERSGSTTTDMEQTFVPI